MNDITETGYVTSEQHKEAGASRMERNDKDIRSMVAFLRVRDPFLQNPRLCNTKMGVTADNNINADSAKTVEYGIIDSMVPEYYEIFLQSPSADHSDECEKQYQGQRGSYSNWSTVVVSEVCDNW